MSYKFGCSKCKTVFRPNLYPSELQLKCPKCKTRQMTNIAAKSKFTKDFCWNDESWDWQAIEDRLRDRMVDEKIKVFGPRLMRDYISIPNEDFGITTKKDDDKKDD